MNPNLIFQELRQLKQQLLEKRGEDRDLLYNQMRIGESLNLTDLKNIILKAHENVDENRSIEELLITNDFLLGGSYGTFTVYVDTATPGEYLKVFLSNEPRGENWVEAEETSENVFELTKGEGDRLRLKVEGKPLNINIIYQ